MPITHQLALPHKIGMHLICVFSPSFGQYTPPPLLYLLREDLDLRS